MTITDLFYDLKDSDDVTMAGYVDYYLIENKYGGSFERYEEEDGYAVRDNIIEELTKGLQSKLLRLLTAA